MYNHAGHALVVCDCVQEAWLKPTFAFRESSYCTCIMLLIGGGVRGGKTLTMQPMLRPHSGDMHSATHKRADGKGSSSATRATTSTGHSADMPHKRQAMSADLTPPVHAAAPPEDLNR